MSSPFKVEVTENTFVVEAINEVFVIEYSPVADIPGGGTSEDTAVTFVQSTPATQWTISHNLGFKPVVGVFSVGSQEIEAEVLHTTVNQTLISFTTPTAGFARLT